MSKKKLSLLKREAKYLVDTYGDEDIFFVAMKLYNSSLSTPDFKFCIRIVRSIL